MIGRCVKPGDDLLFLDECCFTFTCDQLVYMLLIPLFVISIFIFPFSPSLFISFFVLFLSLPPTIRCERASPESNTARGQHCEGVAMLRGRSCWKCRMTNTVLVCNFAGPLFGIPLRRRTAPGSKGEVVLEIPGSTFSLEVGDNVLDYNAAFMFYITTKLSNPHYTPEVSTKTTIATSQSRPHVVYVQFPAKDKEYKWEEGAWVVMCSFFLGGKSKVIPIQGGCSDAQLPIRTQPTLR